MATSTAKKTSEPFLSDIKTLRQRAKAQLEEGAVTPSYGGDVDRTIEILQTVLATEIVCVLRYTMHSIAAQGIDSEAVSDEFAEHAKEEQVHMLAVAERIDQLGGKPNFSPDGLLTRSASEYGDADKLIDMIKENLVAERIAVEHYRELIRFFADKDPTTRVMLEGILAVEEEHATDMHDLLVAHQGARSSPSEPNDAWRTAPRDAFELVLVRHGRTAWNAAGRYQGHSDIPLDDVGRAQAVAIGRELARDSFDYAVTSDLVRASETAEILLAGRSCPLERDPRWRELYFGAWEGLTRAEIDARTPFVSADSPANRARFPTPEGGESFETLGVRVGAAVHSIRARMRAGERALVVTHAGPLHAALRALLGEANATALDVRFVPASITTFVVEPHVAHLTVLNRKVAPIA